MDCQPKQPRKGEIANLFQQKKQALPKLSPKIPLRNSPATYQVVDPGGHTASWSGRCDRHPRANGDVQRWRGLRLAHPLGCHQGAVGGAAAGWLPSLHAHCNPASPQHIQVTIQTSFMFYDMSCWIRVESVTLSKTANLCRTSGSQIGSSQGLLSTWTWPTTTCLGTFKRLVISYVKCNLARRFLTIQNYQESWVGSLPCLAGASCRLGNHMVCIVFSCNFFIICIFFNP